ncbi:MAG: glycosyltransferase family 2 protein [Proteobacteria bacterium]|nr:glycosyltransferase family 2 protein [Pseudomonadota bacterium]
MVVLSSIMTAVALVLALPTLIYGAEVLAGLAMRKRSEQLPSQRPDVTVLVPAHNEEGGISATLRSIGNQLRPGDRLLVIADNCSDNTASLARAGGAEVIVRHDDNRRGKGYALDAGIRHLAEAPTPIVIFVDADCQLEDGAVALLAATAAMNQRPVQACYLIKAPVGAALQLRVAEFAFIVKNKLRPLGLSALGLPCQLTGSGMAFPWSVIRQVDLATGHLVEDMKLGLDLARAGHPPMFCAAAGIASEFPQSSSGTASQRRRWEEGHLKMIKVALQTLSSPAIVRTPALAALALDLLVPPLTLLLLLLVGAFILAAGSSALSGSSTALFFSGLNLALFALASLAAWAAVGRTVLPARDFGQIPLYVLRKLNLYPKVLFARTSSAWIRTDRSRQDDKP